jgi:hypothetical protein
MLYTNLFDAEVCASEEHKALAEEILKINVFSGRKPQLPFAVANDSGFLLSSNCAGDEDFLKLVRDGHICVPVWSNVSTLLESVIKSLDDPDYKVSAWWPAHLNEPEYLTLRHEVADALKANRRAPSDFREMCHYIRAFSDAAQAQCQRLVEPDGQPYLLDRMRQLVAMLRRKIQNGEIAKSKAEYFASYVIANHLPNDDELLKRRSRLYKWVEDQAKKGVDEDCAIRIKELINAQWNAALADRTGYERCHSICRRVTDSSLLSVDDEAKAVVLTELINPKVEKIFHNVSWKEIRVGLIDVDSHAYVAKRYAERVLVNEGFLLAGSVGAVGVATLCTVYLAAGHAGAALTDILGLTGLQLGLTGFQLAFQTMKEKIVAQKAEKDIAGCMAKLRRPLR